MVFSVVAVRERDDSQVLRLNRIAAMKLDATLFAGARSGQRHILGLKRKL